MSEAFVYDAIRTPRGKGKKDGSLHEVKPISLLSGVLRELQSRNQFDTAAVDDVVMGVVSPIGEQGSVIPKVAALAAGWDWRCSGVQLNRFCASGLEAVNMAAMKVRSGWEDLVVAGGVESMSRVPIGAGGKKELGLGVPIPKSYFGQYEMTSQFEGAERIADHWGITRADTDLFGYNSQQRAARAWAEDRFAGQYLEVTAPDADENGKRQRRSAQKVQFVAARG